MATSCPIDPKINWLHCMGDSITNSDNFLYIPKTQQYPHLLQLAIGGNCRARNFGDPGDTTTEMLSRFAFMVNKTIPAVATIYGGINDVSQSISDATTQSNLESMIDQLRTAGCNKIILCNIHTINNGTEPNYNTKRTVIQSVANNKGVVFCDFHSIVLQVADYNPDNLHLSTSGLQKLADKIKATLDAQGWTSILQN